MGRDRVTMQRTSVKAAVVIGVLVYQITSIKISAISTHCLSFMETCMSESDFCEKTTLRNICNPKVESCQIKDSKVCNMTIHSILDQYPTVRRCLCAWEEPCIALEQLTSQCLPETDSQAQSSSFTSSWNPMQEPQISTRGSRLSSPESYPTSHRCASVYKKLEDLCLTRNDECNFPSPRDSCLSLWMELQGTSLSNCTCSLRRRKCQGIWRGVNNNPCIRKALEASSSMGPPDIKESSNMRNMLPSSVQQKSLFLDWKASGLKEFAHETGGSCLQQMTVCLSDEVCNRWMVPLVEACTSRQCNSSNCQQIAQRFYAGLPHNIAQMFVLCDCEQEDQDCLHMKKGLHSGTCGEHLEEARLPICLEIFDSCLTEAHCRSRLEALLSKCWDTEDTQCSDFGVDTCISYLDFALILGGDPECKMALTATMGTTLQLPCTCKGLYNRDLFKCNMIHQLLHNRTYYMSPLKKESTSHVPPQMNDSGAGYNWLKDQLLCVFAYVLLVVVVLLAVMVIFHRRIYREYMPPSG